MRRHRNLFFFRQLEERLDMSIWNDERVARRNRVTITDCRRQETSRDDEVPGRRTERAGPVPYLHDSNLR
jgi:hypothetical protein